MTDLTAAWCREVADDIDVFPFEGVSHESCANIAQALRIAARVMDEGAVEAVARVIAGEIYGAWSGLPEWDRHHYAEAARAALAHLTANGAPDHD